MNQLDILCFQISAKSKNFSIAAQELMISQQAVSKHIKNLESQLGFPLFLRNYQNVVLTKAGKLMLDYFSERQKLLDSVNNTFVLSHAPNELKIICTEWLGNPHTFRSYIQSFQQKHPDINIFIYVLNHEAIVSQAKMIKPDYILTTSYNSNHLPIPFTAISKFEAPLFIVGNSNVNYTMDTLSLYPFFTTNSGELGIQEIKKRTYNLGAPIGFRPSSIQVFDNMGSVFWNVLLQKGFTISPDFGALGNNAAYSIKDSGLTATCLLCRTCLSNNRAIELFEQELANESITA